MKKFRIMSMAVIALSMLAAAGYAAITGSGSPARTAAPEDCVFVIPGTLDLQAEGAQIDVNKVRNSNGELNYVENGGTASFRNVRVDKAGEYKVTIPIDYSYGDGTLKIEVKNAESGVCEASYDGVLAKNNSPYDPIDFPLVGKITEGVKDVTFTFGRPSGYVCNTKSPVFVWVSEGDSPVPSGWMTIPGELDVRKWNYNTEGHGKFGFESDAKGVGYVKNKARTDCNFYALESGVYSMSWKWNMRDGGTANITVTDIDSGKVEVCTDWTIANGTSDILLPGLITEGKKHIVISLSSTSTSWIGNYFSPVLTKMGDVFASVKSVSAEGAEISPLEGYDWNLTLPRSFSGDNVALRIESEGGDIKVSDGENEIAGSNGVYTIPAPALNQASELDITLTPAEGAYALKTEYKARIFRLGDVVLTGLTLDGMPLSDDFTAGVAESLSGRYDDAIFTAAPALRASFADGTTVDATLAALSGSDAEYSFSSTAAGITKNFTLNVGNVHIYNRTEADKDSKVVFDKACVQSDGSWSNGLFSISNCGDGWGGKQFKLKSNSTSHVSIPGDMLVKQIRLAQLYDNYADGRIKSVSCDAVGAKVWKPTASSFAQGNANAYDLVINVDDHTAGAGFDIEIEGGGQPVMWFEFIYEDVNPESSVDAVASSSTSLEGRNHAVVQFRFNRAVNDVTVTFNGSEVKALGGSSTLLFPVWDLEYNRDYTFTIPAGVVTDKYGNVNAEPISYNFTVPAETQPAAISSDRFIIVSDVVALREAVAGLSATNSTAASARTVIFVRNGDYNLGSDLDANGNSPASSDVCLGINKVYNVSIIGESREGVLIHGTRTGISNPVVSLRNSTDTYIENLTIRNDLDFGLDRVGVGVALYGGELDVMKNVTLQSQQDTFVTGSRGYYSNCTFHGTVDYICGGGDHFFDHCIFVQESAGAIAAPNTTSGNRHGYVFSNCTIRGAEGYTLGRPWQNEPRIFWVNTTMESLPAAEGWAGMSNLTTHFYEYNSVDSEGHAIDLSGRRAPSTSLNIYVPVLPEEYADYFTSRNVLGLPDSWDAAAYVVECDEASDVAYSDTELTWGAVKGAAGYLVYDDGELLGFSSVNSYSLPAGGARSAAAYTVAAVNANAAKGIESAAGVPSGIEGIMADGESDVEYYTLQGIRTSADAKGILIRVATDAQGRRNAQRVNKY